MAIQFIDSRQEGLYPTPGMATAAGIAGVGQEIGGAIGAYKKAKKDKEEEAYKKAIEQLAITGSLPPSAADIFKQRYGAGFDPSTIKVSDAGRKIAGLKTDFPSLGQTITPEMEQAAQQAAFNEALGLKSPEEQRKAAQDRVSAYFKNIENLDVDGTPPKSIQEDWKAAGFGEYPTIQGGPDPLTGIPKDIPVPVASAKKKKEIDEVSKGIDQKINLALRGGGFGGVTPDQVPLMIDADMQAQYGPDWKETRPDLAVMVKNKIDAAFPPVPVEPEEPALPEGPTLFDHLSGIAPEIPGNAMRSAPLALGPAGSAGMVWKRLWDRFLPQNQPRSGIGQTVSRGGRTWVVVGFDDDGEPLVEPSE